MEEPSKLTAWERWELASFEGPHAAGSPDSSGRKATKTGSSGNQAAEQDIKLPTAAELERIHQQARDEGFQNGRQEGYQAGFKEGQAKTLGETQRIARAATKLDGAMADLESTVADELLALAVEIARQVVLQEISVRPESLISVVHEALGQLPHQHASIYLHPDDVALLRSHLGEHLAHAGHRIHEDFKLQRGDCVIEAGGTQIDATVAMRWQRVLEGLGIASAWRQKPEELPSHAAGS